MKKTALLMITIYVAVALTSCGQKEVGTPGIQPAAEGQPESPDSGPQEEQRAAGSDSDLPDRYIKVSLFLTTVDNSPVGDARVTIGDVALLPSSEAVMGTSSNEGLYDTEKLEEGSYFFKAEKEGYRVLAGKVEIPPLPEQIGVREPPVVLELIESFESDDDLPSLKALILWQKYARRAPRAHPRMPSRGEKGYHSP